jgi:hypothetical protein
MECFCFFNLKTIALMAGQTNRVQATCQTGEDDLDEELQTDPIDRLEKWTQYPPQPLIKASMTSVVEYQYCIYKIRMVFTQKGPGLKDSLFFLKMDGCEGDKNG